MFARWIKLNSLCFGIRSNGNACKHFYSSSLVCFQFLCFYKRLKPSEDFIRSSKACSAAEATVAEDMVRDLQEFVPLTSERCASLAASAAVPPRCKFVPISTSRRSSYCSQPFSASEFRLKSTSPCFYDPEEGRKRNKSELRPQKIGCSPFQQSALKVKKFLHRSSQFRR